MVQLYRRKGGEVLVNTETVNGQSTSNVALLPGGGYVVVWLDGSMIGADASGFAIKAQRFDADGDKLGGEFLVNTIVFDDQVAPAVATLPSGRFVVTWTDFSESSVDTDNGAVRGQIYEADGTPVGGEFLVNAVTTGSQGPSAITELAGGGFVIAWTDGSVLGGDTSGSGIKAQLFDASGAKVGGEFLVNTETTGGQGVSTAAALPSGGFAVAWQGPTTSSGGVVSGSVRLQLFDAAGVKVGTEQVVNESNMGNFSTPSVTALASGLIVTWTQQDSPQGFGIPSTFDVRAQLFDAAGVKVGDEFVVNSTTAGNQSAADVDALPGGGFLVTWQGNDATNLNIYGQIFDAAGAKLGAEFLVNSVTASNQLRPRVEVLPSGDIVLIWTDNSGVGGDASSSGIKMQILTPSSDAPTDIILSATSISETAREDVPLIALDSDGAINSDFSYEIVSDSTGGAFAIDGDHLVVANNDLLNFEAAPQVEIRIRTTDDNGNSFEKTVLIDIADTPEGGYEPADGEFLVNATTAGFQGSSTIAPLESGGFLMQWFHVPPGGSIPEGRGRLFDADGNPLGGELSIFGHAAVGLPGGGFVAIGQAPDGAASMGLVAQIYDAAGAPVGSVIPVNSTTPGEQLLASVASFASGGFVVTWTDYPGFPVDGDVRAQIFDAAGAKVGGEILVPPSPAGPQEYSEVAVLESGDFVITWLDGAGVGIQMFSGSGARLLSTRILPPWERTTDSHVTALADGGFVVTWADNLSGGGFVGIGNFSGQVFDADGNTVGDPFQISAPVARVNSTGIDALPWGGFVATWTSYDGPGTNDSNVHTQVFDGTGARVGEEMVVNEVTTFDQDTARVAVLESGDFVIAWRDGSGIGGDPDGGVKARLYSGVGPIEGTAGGDTLIGTSEADEINGLGGDDTLDGRAGDDVLDGGADDDSLLVSGTGSDVAHGGSGTDTLFVDYRDAVSPLSATLAGASPGTDGFTGSIATESGDRIVHFDGVERIQLLAGSADDVIHMEASQDDIRGGGGHDEISTGEDNDYLDGEAGDDWLRGEGGHDVLIGGLGDDLLEGGLGNDELIETAGGDDEMLGGDGDDMLFYTGALSDDDAEAVMDGGIGDDLINYHAYGTGDSAALDGGDGDDVFIVTGGGDLAIDAGAGGDYLELVALGTHYTVSLGAGSDLLALHAYDFPDSQVGAVTVSDFGVGDGADALGLDRYLSIMLEGWDRVANPFASGHLALVQRGADAVVRIDRDGAGNGYGFADLVVLQNVAAASLTPRNLGGWAANGSAAAGQTITGTSADEILTGTSGNDLITGLDGDDTLHGASGNDRLEGGEGNDVLNGAFGNDQLFGGAGNDRLLDPLGGSDQLFGQAGMDVITVDRQIAPGDWTLLLDGGADRDTLIYFGRIGSSDQVTLVGGDGDDWITAYRGGAVTINAGDGADFILIDVRAASYEITLGTSAAHVDILALGNSFGPITSFNVLDFTAGSGGDMIQMRLFLDSYAPAWDPNTNPFQTGFLLLGQHGADAVILIDQDGGGDSFALLGTLENVSATALNAVNLEFTPGPVAIVGTDQADSLAGTAGNDDIRGFAGDDVLNGGGGADAMQGGAGNDLYIVDNAGDVVIEAPGGGADAIYSSVSYALNNVSEVENLSTLDWNSTAALNLTGNALANYMIGNAGVNILDGKGGADILVGRQGNDIYIVDDAGDIVYENAGEGADSIYTSVSFALNDALEAENLSTLDWNSTAALALTGNNLANYMIGNAGANVLRGNGGNDIIEAKAGDDTIIGGSGADALFGGLGNDVYIVEDALDAIIENGGEGLDAVYASLSYTLAEGSEVETLSTLDWNSTASLNLTGNNLVNYMIGNAGVNILDGKGGADILAGRQGNDIYIVDNSGEIVYENVGEGADSIYTSASFALNDQLEVENLSTLDWNAVTAIDLTGNSLANWLIGNAGANVIDGKGGNDILEARTGADTLAFTTALGGGNVDLILGFATGSDRIHLDDAVFTGLGLGALNANAFVTGSAAGDADDRIVYNSATGALFFDADGNGAGAAIQFATLQGAPALSASDFAVI